MSRDDYFDDLKKNVEKEGAYFQESGTQEAQKVEKLVKRAIIDEKVALKTVAGDDDVDEYEQTLKEL